MNLNELTGTETPWNLLPNTPAAHQRLGRCKPCKAGFTWDAAYFPLLRDGIACPQCKAELKQTTAMYAGPWYGLFA